MRLHDRREDYLSHNPLRPVPGPRGSREIIGVCGWEVGGHLGGGTWKEGPQSAKEKPDQSSLTLEKSTWWWSWECRGNLRY